MTDRPTQVLVVGATGGIGRRVVAGGWCGPGQTSVAQNGCPTGSA
jgi:hypothetical protein